MQPRPYQNEALDALDRHVRTKDTNPCIVLPTGAGKSPTIAWIILRWMVECPWLRVIILAHRKELIEQNADKLRGFMPGADVGIFSAALKRRDYDSNILFASIDSVYDKAGEFQPFDVIMVDEAHRIPPAGEGKYRTFIKDCRRFNPNIRVVGWTATPFRMGCGQICHKDHILNEICYEANVADLIRDGYLCKLRSKVGVTQPNLECVKRNSGGDYILNSLAEATNTDAIVSSAVAEAVRIIRAENRHHVVFFCVDIDHCKKVAEELRRHGVFAPCVTGKTPQDDRARIVADFKAGKLEAICNVNVYSEGFDAPLIDCIVLLRPTLSAGLYYQMVGRGLRLCDGKGDCLVLDFANCIDEHGPIDILDGGKVAMITCPQCRESFSRAVRVCPSCGWVVPPQEIKRAEETERQRRMHGDKASSKSILSNEPETIKVGTVFVSRHRKPGMPDSLLVQYRCGLSMFREWVCLDHQGMAGIKAQGWWHKRFPDAGSRHVTVNEALSNLFLSQVLLDWTKTITVVRNGRFFEVIDWNRRLPEEAQV